VTSSDVRTRVLIVDDEPVARRGLRLALRARSDVEIVGECQNGYEAIETIERDGPDLVLLDVQMPGLDGFGVIRSVGVHAMPSVIFVTAFDEFALRAFDVAAVDYVVKPFAETRLLAAVERATTRLREHRVTRAHERLLEALGDGRSDLPSSATRPITAGAGYATRLLVSVGAKSIVVPLSDVTLFQADGYHILVWAGDARYTLRGSLQDLELRLDPSEFLRIHRSSVVRFSAVKSVERAGADRVLIVLADGTKLPVSRSRREFVIHALGCIRG
jgi:two-component system, LytTR family, response regulator